MRAQRDHEYPPTAARAPDPYKNNLTFCISEPTYTAVSGDTRDSISLKYSVSPASLYMGDPISMTAATSPPAWNFTSRSLAIPPILLKTTTHVFLSKPPSAYHTQPVYGHVLCGAPQGGAATGAAPPPGVTSLPQTGSYTETAPPTNATVAKSTTFRGGKWRL
ncbi:uncharacterized protein Aud_002734 [Aspergillus udagawae]|uniref:Uncharacterized protein n=1 Tax=Aspergillus udagawae TaxID=91492 RepID=A0A8E0QKA8_9EURO|nr:uncharacterized protein Aud_002734 [Aspergillus udagawae]GIC86364.1 hypothetical protein Aud_002734 [Aspergillus udagawae]